MSGPLIVEWSDRYGCPIPLCEYTQPGPDRIMRHGSYDFVTGEFDYCIGGGAYPVRRTP
jgi:hypothetical protein